MTESIRKNQDEYDGIFKGEKLRRRALEEALLSRKFEIELYWKRATYFWTLIGAAFVAYATILASSGIGNVKKDILLGLMCSLGFIFSLAWYYANKGSKYWQENWENHVELLEDEAQGKLYKTILERPESKDCCDKVKDFFIAPKAFSVSKINQILSLYVVWIWVFLGLAHAFSEPLLNNLGGLVEWLKYTPVIFSIIAFVGFKVLYKSHEDSHDPICRLRKTKIKPKSDK